MTETVIETVNGSSIPTTTYRSHWVSETGARYESRWLTTPDGPMRLDGLRPVLNLDELAAYVALGVDYLPEDRTLPPLIVKRGDGPVLLITREYVSASVWYGHMILRGECRDERTIERMVEELAEDVPRYAAQWRAPFVESRERFPAPPRAASA